MPMEINKLELLECVSGEKNYSDHVGTSGKYELDSGETQNEKVEDEIHVSNSGSFIQMSDDSGLLTESTICRNAEKDCVPDIYDSTSSVFASEVNQDPGSGASTSEALTVHDSGQKKVSSLVNVSNVEKCHVGSVNELNERLTSTGTTVIGVKSRYGVFLLHDGLKTTHDGQYIPCSSVVKGGEVYGNIYCVNAGNCFFLEEIRSMLTDIVARYISLFDTIPSIRVLSKYCVIALQTKEIKDRFPRQQAHVILAAIENGVPMMHFFARNWKQEAREWSCIRPWQSFGSGSRFASMVIKRFIEYPDTKESDYVNMLVRAVVKASRHDKGTGGNVKIMLLTSDEDMEFLVDEDVHDLQMLVDATTRKWKTKNQRKKEAKLRRREKRRKKNRRRSEARKKQGKH